MKYYILIKYKIYFFFIHILGSLIFILSLLVKKNKNQYLFIGHLGSEFGTSYNLFINMKKNYNSNFIVFKNGKYYSLNIFGDKEILNHFKICKIFYFSKNIIITTPGYLWFYRKIFSKYSNIILATNGFPLKEPGLISRNFTFEKKIKYEFFWSDIKKTLVSSRLEKYLASSSLNIDINKFRVIGPARLFYKKKKTIKNYITKNFLINLTAKTKFILVAPTHRSFNSKYKNIIEVFFKNQNVNSFLKKYNLVMVIRGHVKESITFQESSRIKVINSDLIADISEYLNSFHYLITDYSGIYLDLLDTNIKIGLLRLKGDDFELKRGTSIPDIISINVTQLRNFNDFEIFIKGSMIGLDFVSLKQMFHESIDSKKAIINGINEITK